MRGLIAHHGGDTANEEKTTYVDTPTVPRRLVHVCAAQLAYRGTTVRRDACLIDPNVVLVNVDNRK